MQQLMISNLKETGRHLHVRKVCFLFFPLDLIRTDDEGNQFIKFPRACILTLIVA